MTDEVFAPLTRAYVDDPGNWSALDGRRQVILDLLDRDTDHRRGAPNPTATPGVGDDMRAKAIEAAVDALVMTKLSDYAGDDLRLIEGAARRTVDALIAAGFIAGGISALKEEK